MAEPTLSNYAELADFAGPGTAARTTTTLTWSSGDRILAVAISGDNGNTFSTPTGTGLTFSSITNSPTESASNCRVQMWQATAASSGSSAISTTIGGGSGPTDSAGICAFAYSNSNGFGAAAQLVGSTNKVIPLTRTGANSHVVAALGDWNAVADADVDATPTGTVRHEQVHSGQAGYFVVSFGDQGAAGGPTSYGITNHTGTVKMTGLAVEVLGVDGGAGLSVLLGEPIVGGSIF